MSVLIIDAGMQIGPDQIRALTGAGWPVGGEDRVSGLDQGDLIYLLGPVGGLDSLAHARLRERALALAPRVRVNGICAGPVVAHNEQWPSLSLSPKVPTADVVSTVRFILDTGTITGQVIVLGGE